MPNGIGGGDADVGATGDELGQENGDRGGGAVCATEKKRTNTWELGHLRRWITHRGRLRRAGN
jgi:hypothetical protein